MITTQMVWSQSAEPAVTGANFSPNSIAVGQTSVLTISFANSGFDPIPPQSVELTVSTAFEYYEMDSNPPGGPAGSLFSWSYLGQDVWRGTNINAIPAFGGGDIHINVTGLQESPSFEATNVNLQPVANFAMFENSPSNDNLQPELRITPASCLAGNIRPAITSSLLDNQCPGTSVNLNSVLASSAPQGSSLIWSNDSDASNGLFNVVNPIVSNNGFYYAYFYDSISDCYSPASNPVTVTISGCNGQPVAINDNVTANFNTPLIIDALANDSDPDNQPLTIFSVGNTNQGATVSIVGSSIRYTPPTGFSGTDFFTYTVCDNGSPQQCDNATVTVQVNDVLTFQNQCPELFIDIADIHEGPIPAGNVLVWSTDSDPSDGISPVLNNIQTVSNTVYVYYFDPVGGCYSPGALINLDINSCNDAPVAQNDSQTGQEDETLTGNVGNNDMDPNGDNLTYAMIDDVDNGSLNLNPDGSYSYTPDIEFVGTDQFTYRVCDNGNPQLCDQATVTFTVTVMDFVCVDINSKVFLEGKIISPGGQIAYGQEMRTDLNDLRLLPGQSYVNGFAGNVAYAPKGQPYTGRPWLYNGDEGDQFDSQGNPNFGDAGYPATVVDWVLVSLRESVDDTPASIVCQEAVLLHKDGTLEMVEPCCGVDRRKEYFIVVEHRNHLLVMSPQKVNPTRVGSQSDQVKYSLFHDFTLANSYQTVDPNFNTEIGFGQKQLPNGRWVMIGGNAEQKFTHDDTDLTVDDEVIWGAQNSNVSLYMIGDFNLNGDINFNDRVLWEQNNGQFSSVPRDKNQ